MVFITLHKNNNYSECCMNRLSKILLLLPTAPLLSCRAATKALLHWWRSFVILSTVPHVWPRLFSFPLTVPCQVILGLPHLLLPSVVLLLLEEHMIHKLFITGSVMVFERWLTMSDVIDSYSTGLGH